MLILQNYKHVSKKKTVEKKKVEYKCRKKNDYKNKLNFS